MYSNDIITWNGKNETIFYFSSMAIVLLLHWNEGDGHNCWSWLLVSCGNIRHFLQRINMSLWWWVCSLSTCVASFFVFKYSLLKGLQHHNVECYLLARLWHLTLFGTIQLNGPGWFEYCTQLVTHFVSCLVWHSDFVNHKYILWWCICLVVFHHVPLRKIMCLV